HEPYETLDAEALRTDLGQSKTRLEGLLNTECVVMSYPNGSFLDNQLAIVREMGFQFGFTTAPKRLTAPDFDPLRIPRIGFDNKNPYITARRILKLES
ncbi:MAG: polysaccharide deacetylase family protein, partial [Pseudomonadota bacterium]